MRYTLTALTAAALIAVVAAPALAAKKSAPTYASCESLAMDRGLSESDRRGVDTGTSPFRQFMVSCLAGQVPFAASKVTAPQTQAATTQRQWDRCDALAMDRGIDVNERRGSEEGPSTWRQFMVACLQGKIKG